MPVTQVEPGQHQAVETVEAEQDDTDSVEKLDDSHRHPLRLLLHWRVSPITPLFPGAVVEAHGVA